MPFCPDCKYEYNPGIKKCPDCGSRLVDKLPEEPVPLPEVNLVEVASYPFEVQAQEARLLLESKEIKTVIRNEKISQTDIILAWADGGIKVLVREEDAARASKVLEGNE